MEEDDREVPDYGFGMAPISDTMRKRYNAAVKAGREVMSERHVAQDQLDHLSELKGMFNRCFRKDQWDWSSVHRELGRPRRKKCGDIASILKDLRDAAKYNDSDKLNKSLDKLEQYNLSDYLQHYVDFQNGDIDLGEKGWVYMISKKREPDLIKIGRTDREPFKRIYEINSATGVAYPYSIRELFRVNDSKRAENIAHKLLSEYRVRKSREFFRVPFKKAVVILENEYRKQGLLAERSKGNLKWFDEEKGYGFIERSGEPDVFLHTGSLINDEQVELLQPGITLEFEIQVKERGPKAIDAVIPQSEKSSE